MPRLRQYKNFNFSPSDFTDEINEDYVKTTESEAEGSGKHFLNNAFIISTLPDAQIKQAIEYHRVQINLLTNEICNRSNGLRSQAKPIYSDTSFSPEELESLYTQWQSERSQTKRRSYPKNRTKDKLVSQVIRLLKKSGISAEELASLIS